MTETCAQLMHAMAQDVTDSLRTEGCAGPGLLQVNVHTEVRFLNSNFLFGACPNSSLKLTSCSWLPFCVQADMRYRAERATLERVYAEKGSLFKDQISSPLP